jgi:hypothetical protein
MVHDFIQWRKESSSCYIIYHIRCRMTLERRLYAMKAMNRYQKKVEKSST